MGKKISVSLVEYQRNMIVRSPVEIDSDDYPELDGKTDEEIIDYIKENISDMKPTPDGEDIGFDSLYDDLMEEEIVRDKDLGTDTEIEVEIN